MKKHFTLPGLICIVTLFSFQLLSAQQSGTISGFIHCFEPNGFPVEGVKVIIEGSLLPDPVSVATDDQGHYRSPDLPLGGSYTVTPIKPAEDYIQGVTTFDIVLATKGILLLTTPSPFQLLAADVNQSGTVTTFDALIMRRWILSTNAGSVLQIWRFATTDFEWPNPVINSQGQGFLDSAVIDLLSNDVEDLNWVGVLTGDLNGSGCR